MKMLPVSHKPIETTQLFQDQDFSPYLWRSRCNWQSGVTGGHLRSNEITIRFSPITRDRMEIEMRKWCHTTWLFKTLRLFKTLCILNFLGHDLALTWPWPDLRSNLEIDLLRPKGKCSESARRVKHDGVIFIFVSLISKSINEKLTPWKNEYVSFDGRSTGRRWHVITDHVHHCSSLV